MALSVSALVLCVGAEAWARVGGGDAFSGGHSGGGGGGGGEGGDLFFLIWLCIRYPKIGIPLAILVAIGWVLKQSADKKREDWQTNTPADEWALPVPRALPSGRKQLAGLRLHDPDFSVAVFEDFIYALYAKAQELRGLGQLEQLSAYFSPAASSGFHGRPQGLSEVNGIIVASMRVLAVRGLAPDALRVGVSVLFETNFTEVYRSAEGRERLRTRYALERWELSRDAKVRTRPPEKASKIGCPNCGAALTAIHGSVCSYCGQTVDTGKHDWRVELVQVLRAQDRPTLYSGTVEEQGTALPTVVDPDAHDAFARLREKDPEMSWGELRSRVEMIFVELQTAWSERDWMKARPFVSDSLFQTQMQWMECYRRQRIRNVIEQPKVFDVQLAGILSDRHFDAITVRVIASCIDYVVSDDGGAPLSGSRSRPRRFTEYWTLIRGSKRSGRPGSEPKCPNCGAPLNVNQAGTCEYCQARVTTGQFDWVLSRIEQDEVYTG